MKGEAITWNDLMPLINRLDSKLERIIKTGPRFISRSEIIKEIGRTYYEQGVQSGMLKEIKGRARNSRTLIERIEYENFIQFLKK
jgi:hypothetical protein